LGPTISSDKIVDENRDLPKLFITKENDYHKDVIAKVLCFSTNYYYRIVSEEGEKVVEDESPQFNLHVMGSSACVGLGAENSLS